VNWIIELENLYPCPDALEWAKQFPTAEAAWAACERGDWLLWYAARVGLTPERHRQLIRARCEIARRVLKYLPEEENRPLKAIEAAEKWADNPTATTARADRAAGEAGAVGAAWAAWAAWAAGAAWAAWADRAAELKIAADIVREHLSCPHGEV
jgi:hypothetical protein